MPETLDLSKYTKKDIEQIYLYIDELSIIRIRKVTIKNNIKYKYTVKTEKKKAFQIKNMKLKYQKSNIKDYIIIEIKIILF